MEIDLLVVGIAALFWCVTVGSIWIAARRTSKRISAIEAAAFKKVDEIALRYEAKLGEVFTEARPFLNKVEGALDRLEPAISSLGNIEAIPATVVAGLQPALKAFWNENVGPWATQMGNDALAQVDARIEKITLTLQPLVSVGAKVMGAAGGNAKATNSRNREVADNIRARIPTGLLSLLPKVAKTTDSPEELLDVLMQAKGMVDRFAPGLADQLIGNLFSGATGGGDAMQMLGVAPSVAIVKKEASYMTE